MPVNSVYADEVPPIIGKDFVDEEEAAKLIGNGKTGAQIKEEAIEGLWGWTLISPSGRIYIRRSNIRMYKGDNN